MHQVEVVLRLLVRKSHRSGVFAVVFGTYRADKLTCTFR